MGSVTELLVKISDGRNIDDSVKELWDRYGESLLGRCRKEAKSLLGSSLTGDDLASTVFANVQQWLSAGGDIPGRGFLWGFFLRAISNLVKTEQKRLKSKHQHGHEIRPEDAIDLENVLDQIVFDETIERLERYYQRLTNGEVTMKVLRLRLLGYNQTEIAKRLGIGRRTVYRKLANLAQALLRIETWNIKPIS